MRRMLAVLAIGVLGVTACSDDHTSVGTGGGNTTTPPIPGQGAPEQDRLDAATARWAGSGIEDYEWTYARACFCPQLTVTVEVEGGVAVDHRLEPDESGSAAPEEDLRVLTVVDLFDEVQHVIDTADSFTVEYEPETGRVTSLDVDAIRDADDDEYNYVVRSFEARGDGEPTRLDPATLDESWPCGRGFHVSNADQTTALLLDLTDPTWTEVPPQTSTLPDGRWDARVLVGEDLLANWCDDLIEQSEPEPRTDETWPIVAGTITFADDVASLPSTCDRPVTAHLSGLVAERPDGTQVAIGDLDIGNSCWGGAAG